MSIEVGYSMEAMKIKTIVTVLLIALTTSCVPATTALPSETTVPSLTSAPVLHRDTQTPPPSPTESVRSYPPCAPSYTSSPHISTPWMQLDLSNGLTLKEFHGPAEFDEQESGCRFADRDRAHGTEITLNSSLRVLTKPITDGKEQILVFRNDEQVFESEISQYVDSGLLEAWEYDNHWVIEFVTADSGSLRDGTFPKSERIDIVRDGVSLKKENNYKDVYAFQLLAGKPFYFFKKHDSTLGVNYDGHEIVLDYDDVPYHYSFSGTDKNILQYENMVMFTAEKAGRWVYLEIGVFTKPGKATWMTTFSPTPSPARVTQTPTPEPPTANGSPRGPLSRQGPWLVYLHNSPSLRFADVAPVPAEFVIMNQDSSGRTLITLPECYGKVDAFLMDGGNADNYMAQYGSEVYLFRPSQATAMLVHRQLWYSACNTFFNGDEKGGLLASFYQAAEDVSPELILYELPGGKIRERFPLVRCAKNTDLCERYRSNWPTMMEQEPQWSPNGRYLAFVAILDATSSDLFVYDTQDGNLRRLTNGPDWVGPIEWSRDGTQIIMQELLNDSEFLFDPHAKPPSSVWSVSVSTNEIKLLYTTGDAYTQQNILFWLDEKRFFAYEGFLVNADQARNLRLVDMEAGTNRILFDGEFVMESFDPIHETFALYELESEKYPQGIYLVSVKNGTIRYLEGPPYIMNFPHWDENTGLFVSEDICENDPNSLQAFDHQGNFKCVPQPAPTPEPLEIASYPALDGKWSVSVKDGLWLETQGKPPVLISQEIPSDIIWCPDSSCFFFSDFQQDRQWTLYRVSLPDLTIQKVDEGIQSKGTYQWLGDEK